MGGPRPKIDAPYRRGLSVPAQAKGSVTPLLARFEEDAVGKDIAEFVVDRCLAVGFQGVVPTSNAAPHHPMWHTDRDWMRTGCGNEIPWAMQRRASWRSGPWPSSGLPALLSTTVAKHYAEDAAQC
ncbi:hypothetical protein [Streptomyces ipomoeae]|uniref:hypothetical protein n=1 Tax=Streptomyces ipomoeae TaxID=103232 RepID=UPI0011469F6C|nr:hypothetical protein [Streptomyces ipomoeae]TQE24894.1 hypothetical protein Sipo7851_35560 [Streptomyces ipomoeae]